MKLAMIIDPIRSMKIDRDGSIALAKAALQNDIEVDLIQAEDLFIKDGSVQGGIYKFPEINLQNGIAHLKEYDMILMRLDPPFTVNYVYVTQLLSKVMIENPKVIILNDPSTLRSFNEKLGILEFPKYIPETIVTKKSVEIIDMLTNNHDGIIVKPLNEKGGAGIIKLTKEISIDEKMSALQKVTNNQNDFVMAQEYLKEAEIGDKRITVVDGEIINCILRVPKKGDFRGNISQGAEALLSTPTDKELKVVKKVWKELKKKGITIVGFDFIGEKITEINITSPITGHNVMPESSEKIIQILKKLM